MLSLKITLQALISYNQSVQVRATELLPNLKAVKPCMEKCPWCWLHSFVIGPGGTFGRNIILSDIILVFIILHIKFFSI